MCIRDRLLCVYCISPQIHKLTWLVPRLEEVSKDLSSDLLALGLVVIHDALRSCEHNVPELTGWEKVGDPLLVGGGGHVESGGDNTTLVDTPGEVDYNLAGTVVVDNLELTNVTVLHHHLKELDDHLAAWPDENLTLPAALGVSDALKSCLLYTSPSPRDRTRSRMPSSA
eukprot:TRINITY_DN1924_c0_g1_i6.p1 TRINITY_DN1924_c0_g1~~TRINITY_DN1924_c0_g1_i6.p1  ORF type:complete len:170 (-),score=43.73 TRINITY_DN1924_c0_g1_i6:130-639(-)